VPAIDHMENPVTMFLSLRFILLVIISAVSLLSCSGKKVSLTETRIALGTWVKITVIAEKKESSKAQCTIEVAYSKIKEYENLFDYRSKDGGLALFNNSTSLSRSFNSRLFTLISDSLSYAQLTNGYFDPTILPIVHLWGFETDTPHLPEGDAIKKALTMVGYEKVRIAGDTIEKPLCVQFDLSGIAKGKIVDLIHGYLKSSGFYNFLIDAGGDIYVSGTNLQNKKWRVAIQDPLYKNKYSGVLEKTNTAIVTSGDYERFFTINNTRYSHLFNPKTGFPFSDCRSVTILSDKTEFSDAIATAVFVMGSEKGYAFLTRNGIEGLIIYEDNEKKLKTKTTPGFWE